MSSETPFTSNFIHKYDQPLLEYLASNGTLPNRLLSPITENSADIISNKTLSASSQIKSPNVVLTTDNTLSDELTRTLLQRFNQYITSFHNIQNYLNSLHRHFEELSIIVKHLGNDRKFKNSIEPIETRLVQMRVKRDQIDHLLNQTSIKNLIQQISPYLLKSKLTIDYNELITSIQLSLNQKTTLIDHLKNEYRFTKYQLTEYSSKFKQRHDLLIKLTTQIAQSIVQHDRIIKQRNYVFIMTKHNRQSVEFTNLSNEYKQLEHENYLLRLKAKENNQVFSTLMQSNYH